jgi:hypothetical protein
MYTSSSRGVEQKQQKQRGYMVLRKLLLSTQKGCIGAEQDQVREWY